MQIHVVKSEDTLKKIAQAYGISAKEIADSNQLQDLSRLVVGQTVVIGGREPGTIRSFLTESSTIIEISWVLYFRCSGT